MALKECLVTLSFDKLHIPLIKIAQCIINVSYEDKSFRINYPQTEPLTITLNSPVEREKNVVNLSVIIPAGKKFRKLAKGCINIYKKYFYEGKFEFEKWVYLTVNQTQVDQMSFNTDIIRTELRAGQMNVKGNFYDVNSKPGSEDRLRGLKKAFENRNQIKENICMTNTDRFRAIVEGNNKSLRNLKKGKTLSDQDLDENESKSIKDDLSDFSLSQIDLNEDEPVDYLQLNHQSLSLLDSMKEYLDHKAIKENVRFPKEREKQDELLNSLNVECNSISKQYEKMIKEIKGMNLNLKHKAKELYHKYKEKKIAFRKQRKELNTKNLFLMNEIKVNCEISKKQKEDLKELRADIAHINESPMLKPIERDEDTNIMIDILMDFINNNKEMEINKGLNSYQKSRLKSILASREILDGESEKYIAAIEKIVNENFQNKKIQKIKIEQINSRKYLFENKEANLKFDKNNVLTVNNDVAFEDWLISTFPLPIISSSSTNQDQTPQKSKN